MSFSIPVSIPSIPGFDQIKAATLPPMGERAQALIQGISDRSTMFQNPMTATIGGANQSISVIEQQLKSIQAGVTNPLITPSDATQLLSGFTFSDARSALNTLLTHTDRLSGLVEGQGINVPGLETVLSIGKKMNDYATLLDGASGCLSVVGGMTAVFSQESVGSKTSAITQVSDRINSGVASITEVTQALSNMTNLARGIFSADSTFFQQCVAQVKQAALALMIDALSQDPCAKFVFETVSNRTAQGKGIMDLLNKPGFPKIQEFGSGVGKTLGF
jgi:hypothetical protein